MYKKSTSEEFHFGDSLMCKSKLHSLLDLSKPKLNSLPDLHKSKQTENITSRRTSYRGGNKFQQRRKVITLSKYISIDHRF